MEKEYIWNNLHYTLDDLPRFSIISVFPFLPYTYTEKELDLYKINVQEYTYDGLDTKDGIDFGRGNLGNKEAYYRIHCRTREELFEIHNHLLHYEFNKLQIIYDKQVNDLCLEHYERRFFFNMDSIKAGKEGFYTTFHYPGTRSKEEIANDDSWMGWNILAVEPLIDYAVIQVRVCDKKLEDFITAIKELHELGYKNRWLYPGEGIERYNDSFDNKFLIR